MYLSIYQNLCNRGKFKISEYRKYSGLHEHHIIPEHSGGLSNPENLTYLTIREHIVAHFLLWKIYNKPNDLRAMKMLGAKLTPTQRKIIGEFCRDNKIGIHSKKFQNNSQALSDKSIKSSNTCKQLGIGIFDASKKSKWASEAGAKSGYIQKSQQIGIHNPDNFIKGMIRITNGKHNTCIKSDKLEEYLKNGYRKGVTKRNVS